MARNVQIGKKVIFLLTLSMILLCGCQKEAALDHKYNLENRLDQFSEVDSDGFCGAFADEICVAYAANDSDTSLTADAAGVFEIGGGDAIFEQNVFARMNPASTTKVMTAILALKYGNLSDQVTVTDAAIIHESGSSMAGVKPGDVMSLEDLLYGLMIPSGNDAANAIAVHMSGTIPNFVSMMNEEARRIGATGTHFVNANGLTDPDHYTTAYDLYLIFNEALKYEKFREIIGAYDHLAEYKDASGNPKTATWGVGNFYMNGKVETPEGLTVFGGKTGTTQAAGYCLIMGTRTENGKEYASVIMKADNRDALYKDMTKIITKIDK